MHELKYIHPTLDVLYFLNFHPIIHCHLINHQLYLPEFKFFQTIVALGDDLYHSYSN